MIVSVYHFCYVQDINPTNFWEKELISTILIALYRNLGHMLHNKGFYRSKLISHLLFITEQKLFRIRIFFIEYFNICANISILIIMLTTYMCMTQAIYLHNIDTTHSH